MSTRQELAEVRRLRAAWEAALADKQRHADDESGYYDDAEQRAYDALVDEVEAAGLNYTEHDPRGPEVVA